jgi:hypothetical protein
MFDMVEHIYENGTCPCGQTNIQKPIQDSALKLNHSLNLASDISVNLLVSKATLAGFDMATVYVESTVDTYSGNTKTGTTTLRIEPVENGNYYYFTLNGLTAIQMNDGISSVLYGTKDGQPYYSPVDQYSIATYAYSQMNNAARPQTLKTLCADLLRYGAKAQVFKNYRTNALCDSAMTDAHKAHLSNTDGLAFGNNNSTLSDVENPSVTWVGKSLNLESKVAVKYIFSTAAYHGNLKDLSLRISYVDIYGKEKTAVVTDLEEYNPAVNRYAFSYNDLLAAELRVVLSAQIFQGDQPVSPTLEYSPDTYGNGKTGALGELCTALVAYSDSAKAYFLS